VFALLVVSWPAFAAEQVSRREAVAEALACNPAIEAAREQIAQARARVATAKALPDPSFAATVEDEPTLLGLRSAASKDLGIGLTLPFPTKLRLAGRVATADLRAAEFSFVQLSNQTAAQTAQAYDALLVAARHRRDLTDGRAFAEDFLKKTEARYQAGTVARLDVIKAKVDLAQSDNGLIANGLAGLHIQQASGFHDHAANRRCGGVVVGGGGQRPSLGPARDLPFDETIRSPEVGQVDGDRIDLVEVRKPIDDGKPDATADIGVVLEYHEVRSHDGVIVAEGIRAGRGGKGAPQP
jgi:hypothetical protein